LMPMPGQWKGGFRILTNHTRCDKLMANKVN
jgi:hypothetical protein